MQSKDYNLRINNEQMPMSRDTTSSRVSGEPRILWGPRLAVAAAVVFVISTVFPVAAGLAKDTSSLPKWWGALDVIIAFFLGILAIAVLALAGNKVDSRSEDAAYRAYRVLIHGILAMLIVFFLFGDRVVWTNCLTGFAWRTWLLLYCLPAWFNVLRPAGGITNQSRS